MASTKNSKSGASHEGQRALNLLQSASRVATSPHAQPSKLLFSPFANVDRSMDASRVVMTPEGNMCSPGGRWVDEGWVR